MAYIIYNGYPSMQTHIEEKAHLGLVYGYSDYMTLNDGDAVYMHVKSTKTAHIYWSITTDKSAATELYDNIDSSRITGGTQVNLYNINRNYPDNPSTILMNGVTFTESTSDTVLDKVKQGIDSKKLKSGMDSNDFLILKPNINYVRKIESFDNTNIISISLRIIEE